MMAPRGLDLHITPSAVLFASRIERVTGYLQRRKFFSNVEIAGMRERDLPFEETRGDGRVVRRFKVRPKLRAHSRIARALDFLIWYAAILRHYRKTEIACVNAHTASVLPLCWLMARLKRCALIYEPHELESETATARGIAKTIIRGLERNLARRAAATIAVNPGIAQWYARELGIACVKSVRNLPGSARYEPLPPHYYAHRFGFAETDLVFLYQGIIDKSRGIELLIDAFASVPPGKQLVFLGFGAQVDDVVRASKQYPNVHFHPAVPVEELLRHTAAADAGLLMIEPVSLSYRLCYPNKYCECLTAGVPVLCTESLWLCEEVERFDCGWAAPYSAGPLAQIIRGLDRDAIACKSAGARAWASRNTWQGEEDVLDEIYTGIFGRPAAEDAASIKS